MSDQLFRSKAPKIMRLLMKDFDLDLLSSAAILGNLGWESGGFQFLQEKKPLVPGSAGGYGWAQWTGPRRKDFEAYVARNHLDPASDQANYGWLFVELRGSQSASIIALKTAGTLMEKVQAFERSFERAAEKYKNYDGRLKWANIALDEFHKTDVSVTSPIPPTVPPTVPTAPPVSVVPVTPVVPPVPVPVPVPPAVVAEDSGFLGGLLKFFQNLFTWRK